MNKYKEYWDKTHYKYYKENISYDNWLDEYLELIIKTKQPIIDLGCGTGNNVKYLLDYDKSVIACDYSDSALEIVKNQFFKQIEEHQLCLSKFDMSIILPFNKESADLVIADLSLHYFDKKTTIKILKELKSILTNNGHLLFRINSTKDVNFGAKNGIEIEPHFYFTQGYEKRFFDLEDINYFFNDWTIVDLKKETMNRYQSKKVLWKGLTKK